MTGFKVITPPVSRSTHCSSREAVMRVLAIIAALWCSQAAAYIGSFDPLVAIVQQAFGWTDGEVDALFVEADQV